MKILLIDSMSAMLDFALRCDAMGHEVRTFLGPLKSGERSKVGNGLIERVERWEPSMKWADLIIVSDNARYIRDLESYRKQGYPIIGPNMETTEWELDRQKGQDVLARNGIKTIPSTTFTDYDKAIEHVLTNKKRYVSKPSGDADKALSYVSKSPKDMLFMLNRWKKNGRAKMPFILQEFHGGIEMAVGGWFGVSGFAPYWLENFEHKKLMNNDVGVNTGEMGTVMRYVQESKLADMMLKPLEGELYRQGYTGYIDVAVIIAPNGEVWPLEFTTRPGWPLFQIQQVLHAEPVEWMADMVHGGHTFKPFDDVALGVVMGMPPFPFGDTRPAQYGYPVWGIDKNRYYIHPSEMMLGEAPDDNGKQEPILVTAGNYVLTVSGVGSTVDKAKEHAYSNLKELEFPNSPMYRTDIGDRVMRQLPELKKLGFAKEWR